MPFCATSRPFTISASVSSSAPPSTITIESFPPDTTMSTSENSSCWKVGLRIRARGAGGGRVDPQSHLPATQVLGRVHGGVRREGLDRDGGGGGGGAYRIRD